MKRITIARFAGIAAGAGLALGVFAPVGAQTVAQLQAQIQLLMAQLQQLQGGTGVTNAISSDLTVGSSGNSVVVLQNALIAQGYLTMPAGVSTGYFGALTKAAVMKWQAANSLPATGYFGAMSRAKFNAGGTTGSTTGGTTVGGTTGGTTGVISTPGAEGTLTVTSAPVSGSTFYEGNDMVTLLAFKAEADSSDIALQRVRVDLGTDSDLYREVLSKIYLVDDAGRTVASSDLNTSTVVKDGSNYEITLSGFSSVVAKDSNRTYSIKADVNDSVESADLTSYTVSLDDNGVRGIDGAGIDLYSPTLVSDVTRSVTFSASLIDSASLTVSTNTNNPLAKEVIAAGGSAENEADKVVLLTFDIKADKDNLLVTDIFDVTITNTGTGSRAYASTTYLYKGNCATAITSSCTLLGSAATSDAGLADFTDIDHTINAGATQTYTVAVDVRGASSNAATISASYTGSNANLDAETSEGDDMTSISGSASGNSVVIRNIGAELSLVGSPVLTKGTTASNDTTGVSTTTASANFTVRVKAVGGDIVVGSVASSTTLLGAIGQATTSTTWLAIYKNGASAGTVDANDAAGATSVLSYSQPSTGVTVSGENWTITEGNSVDIPVTVSFTIAGTPGANIYAVQVNGFRWFNSTTGYQNSTFMANKAEWRTNAIALP